MSGLFRENINDAILTQLYEYWRSRRSAEKLPARVDIDPIDIPRQALRHVMLAEIEDGGRQIRCRLVGTAIVEEWSADFTGKYIHEIMEGTYLKFLRSLFLDVVEHRCAVLSESAFRWDAGRMLATRRLFMPLASDGTTIDMVLIGQTFSRTDTVPDDPMKILESLPEHKEVVRIHEMP